MIIQIPKNAQRHDVTPNIENINTVYTGSKIRVVLYKAVHVFIPKDIILLLHEDSHVPLEFIVLSYPHFRDVTSSVRCIRLFVLGRK